MLNTNTIPEVSIIMPTYNRAGYIVETIESIRHQTYKTWELIIVDDGSDDNTEEIVKNIIDERIQFYKAGRSGIGGKIKNEGIKKARGRFIAFIDSDDVWEQTKIEKQVNALEQYSEAGFCLSGGFNFRTPYEPVEYFYKEREGVKVDRIFHSFFSSELPGFTQVLMLRKECLVVTGLFKEEKSFSDLDFILQLAWHFKAVTLYEPLLYRRLHDDSYSDPNWEKSYHEGIDIIRSCKTKKMATPKMACDALYRLYINFGEDCLLHKERKKAFACFFNAWKKDPSSIIPLKKMTKAIFKPLKTLH